ncbi:MAG: D-alanyl-D-alanine carboxypeptidase family protein [Actinobacteria bacterium]|nr:D-alanyl-D-alanine carboxypeptidase family protein [Actinomycetota bacterium]
MPNPTPVRRRTSFVFLPPVVAATVGISLLVQGAFGQPNFELLEERAEQRELAGWVVPTLELTDYLYPRLATGFAGSEWVVVNKLRPLSPLDFEPQVRKISSSESLDNSRGLELRDVAATALEAMAKEMLFQGAGQMFVNSAYRSYDYQLELFVDKVEQYGEAEALVRSAKAGHSEHQTGLAVDVSVPAQGCAIMQCFGDTEAGKWIAENSWKFGYIVRYERDTTSITGYTYEPWHLRYVGTEIARMYASNGIHTLEDFWGFPAAENYPEIAKSTID